MFGDDSRHVVPLWMASRSSIPAFLLGCMAFLFLGCGTFEIGFEPTPTPTPSILRYENTDYGFAFTYPSHWTLEEEEHIVWLRKGTLALRIAYKGVNEAAPIPRPGNSATDGSVYAQKLTFLGQTMPAEAAMYKRKMKAVLYHAPQPVTSSDLIFGFFLRDTAGDETMEAYERVDIQDTTLDEVREILESFERIPATVQATLTVTPSPTLSPTESQSPTENAYPGWARYVNAEYGFAFRYPITWTLAQLVGGQETPFGPTANAVQLARDSLILDIQYQRAGENRFLGTGDVAAGDIMERGPVTFLGEQVHQSVLVFEGKDKRMSMRHETDALEFYIALGEHARLDTPYEALVLPEAIQAEVDQVLRSFELVSGP